MILEIVEGLADNDCVKLFESDCWMILIFFLEFFSCCFNMVRDVLEVLSESPLDEFEVFQAF